MVASVELSGKILEVASDSIKILHDLEAEMLVSRDKSTSVEIRFITDRSFIRHNQSVQFVAPVSRTARTLARDASTPLAAIAVHMGSPALVPGIKVLQDVTPVQAEVRGLVRQFDPATGKLTVATGKGGQVTRILSNEAVVTVHASDIHLAKQGDRITVHENVMTPNAVRASSVVINKESWPLERVVQTPQPNVVIKDADEAGSLLRQADKLEKDARALKLKDDPDWRKVTDSAIQIYQRILEKYPDSASAEQARKRLEESGR
jgi:hypothetical protein